MKKTLKIIISILFVFYGGLIFFAETLDLEPENTDFNANKLGISFEEAIKKITILHNKGEYLDDIDECLSIVEYCDLYLDEAINLLHSNVLSEDETFVIIEMMQFLNYENYIKFFKICTDLYIKDILYTYQIIFIINNNIKNNNKIIRSFYKPKVIKCLLKIKKKANNPETDININGILSGLSWIYTLIYYFFMDKET